MAGNYLVASMAVEWILGRKDPMRVAFLMCCNVPLQWYHLHQLCRLAFFLYFGSMKSIMSNRLCFIWLRVTIFSLGGIHSYSISLDGLTWSCCSSKHLCKRKGMSCQPRVALIHLLVELVFTPMYVWYLAMRMGYDPFLWNSVVKYT